MVAMNVDALLSLTAAARESGVEPRHAQDLRHTVLRLLPVGSPSCRCIRPAGPV